MSVKLWLSVLDYIRGFEIATEVFCSLDVATDFKGKIYLENSQCRTEE